MTKCSSVAHMSIDAYLLEEQSCQIPPDPIWNDGVLVRDFWRALPQQEEQEQQQQDNWQYSISSWSKNIFHISEVQNVGLPLVYIPIQFRYRVSFLLMYVFPRAGSPTMTTTHGATITFAKSGHKSISKQCAKTANYNIHWQGTWESQ